MEKNIGKTFKITADREYLDSIGCYENEVIIDSKGVLLAYHKDINIVL